MKQNRSIDRAFTVLEYLADHPGARLCDVSVGAGLAPPTALRFLGTLVALGYVRQLDRGYSVASRLAALGRGWSQRDAVSEVEAGLRDIADATGCTAFLVDTEGDEVVYRYRVSPSDSPLVSTTRIGHRAPLYCTGVGKALLAARGAAEVDAYLQRTELEPYTEHTITDPMELRQRLAEIHRRGYSIDDEECETGVRCIAVPVVDREGRVIAAASISGPAARFTPETRQAQVEVLQASTGRLAVAFTGAAW